jgi:surface antigen
MDIRQLLAPMTVLLMCLPLAAPADPPPWAPAHGYRAKHGGGEYECEYKKKFKKGKYEYKEKCKRRRKGRHGHDDDYERHRVRVDHGAEDYRRQTSAVGIPQGTCHKEVLVGLLGAAGGGFLGSKVGKGDGQLAATAAGTVIGYIVGSSLGRFMDDVDQSCVGQALERASDRQTVAWTDGRRDSRYEVTPTRTFRNDGRYCRDFVMDAIVDGRSDTVRGTACRNPDGSWTRI